MKFSDHTYTVYGFWVSVVATLISVVSLILTIFISNSTRKIRHRLILDNRKQKFKKTKGTILLNLTTAYNLARQDNRIDYTLINETLISISYYQKVLKFRTRCIVKKLTKALKSNSIDKIANLLYGLQMHINDELDEIEEYVKAVVR